MTGFGEGLADLPQRLWQGSLPDPTAPERALCVALEQNVPYREIEAGLRSLWRMGLPGAKVATQARARWPRSIDMALLSLELGPPEASDEGLAHLTRCVLQQNRRRAALAKMCWRLRRPALAQKALAQIDLASGTAIDDVRFRAELAIRLGDFEGAGADLDWLEAQGKCGVASVLRVRLVYRRDGAAALEACLAQVTDPDAPIWAQAFELFLNENDFRNATLALMRWKSSRGADRGALARAQTRLALARGDFAAAKAMLEDRLDRNAPWHWAEADHVQWLRTGLAEQRNPADLLRHAVCAGRVYPRHDWLAHLARVLREAVDDWRKLESDLPVMSDGLERALNVARAALRMGLSGRAACVLAVARRAAQVAPDHVRLHALRSELLWMAGRDRTAQKAQCDAKLLAGDAVQQADVALLGAEIALLQGNAGAAAAAIEPLWTGFPDRMPLWLMQARIAFLGGAFDDAMAALATFNSIKQVQIGALPPEDVRDRIVTDAAQAARGVGRAFAVGVPVSESLARAGMARIVASPGLSACLLARARVQGALEFQPDPAACIPKHIVHYWQGAPSPALERARAQWCRLHPEFEFRFFNEATATEWLRETYDPALANRFLALEQPALRADLFRLCWLVRRGGVFADLDEYPRIPVTPWLRDARAVLCIERGFGSVANNFVAATPEHPISIMALEFALSALDQCDVPYAWWHTGPAQWTRAAFAHYFGAGATGVRFLSQAAYCRRVATNLPYPHKRGSDHWR